MITPSVADEGMIGTRSPDAAPVDSTAPMVVLQKEQLLRSGFVDLHQILAAHIPGYVYPQPSVVEGSEHVKPASFRGFAPDQVLVLVNGKRWQPSSQYHRRDVLGYGSVGVDLSMLPLTAIKRVEVLKDGASAQYGSGAIGGVINVVLDETPSGIEFTTSFGQHRTHIDGVPKFISFASTQPTFFLFEAEHRPQAIDDGDGNTFTAGISGGFDLFDDGFLRLSASYRQQDPTHRGGPDPRPQYPALPNGNFDPREGFFDRNQHRFGNAELGDFGFMVNAGTRVSKNLQGFARIAFFTRSAESGDLYRRSLEDRNLVDRYPHGYLPLLRSDIVYRDLAFGISGRHWDWDWELVQSFTEDEMDFSIFNSLNASLGDISPDRFVVANNEGRITSVNLDVTRTTTVFQNPAQVSWGIELTQSEYENEIGDRASYINGGETTPDGRPQEIGAQGRSGIQPLDDFDESDTSTAFYAELDIDATDRLHLLLAGRYDKYSVPGGVASAKLAARWRLNEAVSLRASAGQNFRAPALAQSHFTWTQSVITDSGARHEMGLYGVETATAQALGAKILDHEKSLNLNLGMQYRPSEFSGASLDVYVVDVTDKVMLSRALTGSVLAGVPGVGAAGVESASFSANGFDTRTSGVDLLGWYRWNSRIGPLDLGVGLNVNRVEVELPADSALYDREVIGSVENGTPDSMLHLSAVWNYKGLRTTLRAIGYGEVTDAAPNEADDLVLDPQVVVDLIFDYALNDNANLTFAINNFADAYPDAKSRDVDLNRILPFSNFSPYGYNGRQFVFKLRLGL